MRGVLLLLAMTTALSCKSPVGSQCSSAGGTCLIGSAVPDCAKQAASAAQDCEPDPPTPAGRFCCLDDLDAATVD